jgi:hypothetical protein
MIIVMIAAKFATWTTPKRISLRDMQQVNSRTAAGAQITHVVTLMPHAHFSK